jgi:predicted HicB family RNase H-like nuclease
MVTKRDGSMPTKKQLSTTPLRIPVDLKEWAKAQAKAKDLSLNAWIIDLLMEMRRNQEAER